MDVKKVRADAARSLKACRDDPSRLTLRFLLVLYGVAVAVELATLLLEDRLADLSKLYASFFLWSGAFTLLLRLIYEVWKVGFQRTTLRISRGERVSTLDLAAGVRQPERFALLYLLEAFFVVLWSLLLIVPGVIALYRYRLASRLLLDHPKMSPLDALTESARLMRGHKRALFRLDLSFWLHYLLVLLLESGVRFAEYLGYPIEGRLWQIVTLFLTTGLLLLVEWHRLPLVQTSYACAYDQICACNGKGDVL